jgi:hypothetical protein
MGLLWHAAHELDSAYTVRAEWKIYADDDNSGMFIGFPDPGDDPWQPVSKGYEIQIDPTDEPVRTTGAVYSFQAPDEAARAAALRPYGEWNVMEVSVDGTQITVRLNGTVINEYTSPHPERSPMTGFVGIQNDGAGRDVTYRSVQLRDDSPPPPDPITQPADPPFGSPPGGSSPPPLVDEPAAYRLSGAARRVTKRRFARHGLRLQLSSSEAARGTARVVVSRQVARRLGLARRLLASRGVQFTGAGSRTLRLKPGRAMARRLGRARGAVRMTLEITLRDAGGEATTITRRITLD